MNRLIQAKGIVFQVHDSSVINIDGREVAYRLEMSPEVIDYFEPLFEECERFNAADRSKILKGLVVKSRYLTGDGYLSGVCNRFLEEDLPISYIDRLEPLSEMSVFHWFETSLRTGKKDYPSFNDFDNDKVRNSFIRVLRRQQATSLINIHISDHIGMQFSHIYIGIEKDGYAHS